MTNAAKLAGYVGAALTADGTAGILTAITYIGDGSSLTGIADTANIVTEGLSCSGVITATGGVVGNVTGTATGLGTTASINTTGIITAASVSCATGDFSGTVSIAGTLSYQDVTNVDSVGLITARSGLTVTAGGVDVTAGGIDIAAGGCNVTGVATASQGVNVTTGGVNVTAGGLSVTAGGFNVTGVSSVGTACTFYSSNVSFAGGLRENVKIVAAAINSGTNNVINIDHGMVHLFTSNSGATFTPNIVSTAGINTDLKIGDNICVTVITAQNNTSYYAAQMMIEGVNQTEEWNGGSAPSAGGAGGYDMYTYNIIKTAATPTYLVLSNVVNYA